jgi:hypothetical protein
LDQGNFPSPVSSSNKQCFDRLKLTRHGNDLGDAQRIRYRAMKAINVVVIIDKKTLSIIRFVFSIERDLLLTGRSELLFLTNECFSYFLLNLGRQGNANDSTRTVTSQSEQVHLTISKSIEPEIRFTVLMSRGSKISRVVISV